MGFFGIKLKKILKKAGKTGKTGLKTKGMIFYIIPFYLIVYA